MKDNQRRVARSLSDQGLGGLRERRISVSGISRLTNRNIYAIVAIVRVLSPTEVCIQAR
jgi:hypothetical protein